MKNVYSIKFLYFNAGKTVLNHCTDYCRNLADNGIVSYIYNIFIKGSCCKNIFINDKSAVLSHHLLSFFIQEQEDSGPLFVYEDCLADGLMAGVFSPSKNLFIYNSRMENADVYMDNCYKRRDETKAVIQKFYNMAQEYFIKSECIDIPNNL